MLTANNDDQLIKTHIIIPQFRNFCQICVTKGDSTVLHQGSFILATFKVSRKGIVIVSLTLIVFLCDCAIRTKETIELPFCGAPHVFLV